MRRWIESARDAGGAATGAEAHPAATVAILRDGSDGLEVLLCRRSSKLAFHGGAWVFPGGRIDPEDWDGADDVLEAARRAAAREAEEEAGLRVDADALVHVSNWTTPEISPKRFATWFFAGPAVGGVERADGGETEALRWFRPAEALVARHDGEIELAPPQYVTLLELERYATIAEALAALDEAETFDFAPRFHFLEAGGAICVYADDVAWDDLGRLEEPGPRHRLVMLDDGWSYVRLP